jgi:hypothetical protein
MQTNANANANAIVIAQITPKLSANQPNKIPVTAKIKPPNISLIDPIVALWLSKNFFFGAGLLFSTFNITLIKFL